MSKIPESFQKNKFPSQEKLDAIEDAEIVSEEPETAHSGSEHSSAEDDVESVINEYKNDLLKSGYEPQEVDRFIKKAFRPLIKESDFENFDLIKANINRIFSNFRKEQDLKRKRERETEHVSTENLNKQTLRKQAIQEYQHQTPQEVSDEFWDAQDAGREYAVKHGTFKKGPQKGTKFSTGVWQDISKNLSRNQQQDIATESALKTEINTRSVDDFIQQIDRLQTLVNKRRERAGISHNQAGTEQKLAGYVAFKLQLGKLKRKLESYKDKELTSEDKDVLHEIRSQIASYGQQFRTSLAEYNKNNTDTDLDSADVDVIDIKNTQNQNDTRLRRPAHLWFKKRNKDGTRILASLDEGPINLTQKNGVDITKDEVEASEASQGLLFGMQLPKAGPESVFGVRAFEQALHLIEGRVLPELQKDPEKRKQYNEILQIVTNVPDTGLTSQEADRLSGLTQSIAMPESVLQFNIEKTVDTMSQGAQERIIQKLPAMGTLKKKRGFFTTLARAAIFSLPFIATGSELDTTQDLVDKNNSDTPVTTSTASVAKDIPVTTIHRPAPRPDSLTGSEIDGVSANLLHQEKIDDTKKQIQEEITPTEPLDTSGYPYSYTEPEEYAEPDAKSPYEEPAWVKETILDTAPVYTFEKNSTINTVSEALLETWKQQRTILDQPLTENEFQKVMYTVLSELEKDPKAYKELAEQMQIPSLNIEKVQVGDTVNLQPLIDQINYKLQ